MRIPLPLASRLTGGILAGDVSPDIAITHISTDTRTLAPGDCFLALRGESFDGHDFLSLAAEKGATALIVEHGTALPDGIALPTLYVEDTLAAFQTLAAWWRGQLDIPVVGVTGSSGKTTTKDMIATVLATRLRVYATAKNYNNHIGLPHTLQGLRPDHEAAVLEMGMNHAGEIALLARLARPTVAVVVGIGTAHIEHLGSREGILAAKLEIAQGLAPDGALVLNGDDDLLGALTPERVGHPLLFTTTEGRPGAYLSAQNIISAVASVAFDAVTEAGERARVTLPVVGRHNVADALLALAVGRTLGLPLADMAQSLAGYVSSSLRGEVHRLGAITLIKDYYNANPESVRASLQTLADAPATRRIAIVGEMLELGDYAEQAHREAGALCTQLSLDTVFFVGGHADAFVAGCPAARAFADKPALIDALAAFVRDGGIRPGDTVLLKGSRGMKLEEVYEPLRLLLTAVAPAAKTAEVPGGTRLHVDISAIKHNLAQLRRLAPGARLMPVVKANAYGAGADIAANLFRDCRHMAVADAREAAQLRVLFPDTDMVLLYQPPADAIPAIVAHRLTPGLCDLDFARALGEAAQAAGISIGVHLEVDTGMGRLGVPPEEAGAVAYALAGIPGIALRGIYTHYACADSPRAEHVAFTREQTARFCRACADAEAAVGHTLLKHACAGAAMLTQPDAHFDLVRPGYMLYGYYPDGSLRERVELRPALRLTARVLQVKRVPPGTPIGYGCTFTAARESVVATVAAGYADGVSRLLSNRGCCAVNGQRAPIVGTVCMDMTMLDVTDIHGAVRVGDEVAVFDNVNVTVEDIAAWSGTIGYEVITRIQESAQRVEGF